MPDFEVRTLYPAHVLDARQRDRAHLTDADKVQALSSLIKRIVQEGKPADPLQWLTLRDRITR